MSYRTADGLPLVEGLDVIRRRPAMYLGGDKVGSARERLLEIVVEGVAHETPLPQEVRVLLWCEDTVTVAYGGAPLPIKPICIPADAVLHPALYRLFMCITAGEAPSDRLSFGAISNALSERLVVSTVHDGSRYRAVFSKGMLVSLLASRPCSRPLGVTWLTFRPDATIVPGEPLTPRDVEGVAERVLHPPR